jgi:hypothetical protein
VRTLELGLGVLFFVVGLIMALSKSAKGATLVTFLLGIVGGGGGIICGEGHVPFLPKDASPDQQASNAGALLLAVGVGCVLGLGLGLIIKAVGKKRGVDVEINVAQPGIDPNSKL